VKRKRVLSRAEAMLGFVSTNGAIGNPAASAPVQPSPRL
jgi:hypothetical protein